jgi:hypothetical protein
LPVSGNLFRKPSADEYDAAQKRGEIPQQGAHVAGDNMSTADLGLTSKEVHEARRLRNAAV